MAMLVTQISTATAAVAWMFVEWGKHGKPSALGIVTGAVAGMVAITPASGSVGPHWRARYWTRLWRCLFLGCYKSKSKTRV